MTSLCAHTPNHAGQWHSLEAHLVGTAERASRFGAEIGPEAAALAYQAGLWHDIGKAHPRFQEYLRDQHEGRGRKGEGGDHKGAGAVLITGVCDWLAFLIAGHHGGLPSGADLRGHLSTWTAPESHVPEALAAARGGLRFALEAPGVLPLPEFARSAHERELLVRMLFSCLVDADFLDTEAHFDPARASARLPSAITPELWECFAAAQEARIARNSSTPVNAVRERVYRAAVTAASLTPGFFRLTVPTGGGKTLTSMGFGLRHALTHGFRRVVVAVPYTTITEQTAAAYREVFEGLDGVVLEHHSAVERGENSQNDAGGDLWRRLGAENWEAPIIVTTTVQLFGSLLGAGTAAIRKLHNLVGSVIVLDEAQALPARLLQPLLDVLRELVRHYRVSVVFCTATQPAFEAIRGFQDLAAREIAPDPPALFAMLARVTYEWPAPGQRLAWGEVAERFRVESQALVIVNTRPDALALLDALDDPSALHLSTLLCGAHRRDILKVIRQRLKENEPCRVVATQVVEAGVDVDFPLVLRAVGPLDSLVQAAGRCNREGLLGTRAGRVLVFEPAEGGLPPGDYALATAQTRTLLADGVPDLDHPDAFLRYFGLLLPIIQTDRPGVQALRRSLDYPATARAARLIQDDTVPVVVRYRGPAGDDSRVDGLLARLTAAPHSARPLLRLLQPYVVAVRQHAAQQLQRDGWMREVVPGLGVWEWLGDYDLVRGIRASLSADVLIA